MTISFAFDLPFPEAIAQLEGRGVVLPEAYYNDLPADARRVAFSVSGLARLDQVQSVLDRLCEHLEDGGTLATFQKWAAEQDWSLPKHRLETIFRNAVQTAYNAGHWRHFEDAKDARPYLMYDAINDSRVRPSHLALDGVIRRVDDPFWRTHSPPLGHRCRCALLSLSESQAQDRSNPGNDGQPRGVHKPETPDMKADDDGWGHRPDLGREETLRRLLEKRRGQCGIEFGWKRKDQPVWCSGPGQELLDRLFMALAVKNKPAVSETRKRMDILDFAARVEREKDYDGKPPVGAFTGQKRLFDLIGEKALWVNRIALRGSYLRHAIHNHAPGGVRQDKKPIATDDLFLLEDAINQPDVTEWDGKRSESGNPLVKYARRFEKGFFVVIAEVTAGKARRSLTVFNFYWK
jgi:SPP1 gp7 family putative phage head morphogenesis protein